jgi:hypothetical protein
LHFFVGALAVATAALILTAGPGSDVHVVADARGDAAVAWESGLSRPRVMLSVRRAGGRFGPPRALGGGRAPRLGIDAAGDVLVAWQSGSRVRARWRSARGRLSRVQEVDPRAGSSPGVAVSAQGVGVVVWEDRGVWAASGRANRRLGALQRVADAATSPRVAVGADGSLVAAWRGGAGIEAAAAAAGRPFGAVERVSAPLAHDSVGSPELRVAPDGGAVVAWDQVEHPGLAHPIAIAAAWRDPGAPSFSAPQTISGSPPPIGALRDLAVAAGPGGYGLVVWPADDLMFGTALEYAERPGVGTFGPQQALDARPNRSAESPAAVIGMRGEPIVAWQHSTGVACPSGRTESCYDTGLRPLVAIGSPLGGRGRTVASEGMQPSVAAVPGAAIVAWSGDRVAAALVRSR